MVFNFQLLNFDRTDSNAIYNIVFASLFYMIISVLIAYLSDKTRRIKLLKKMGVLRLSADLSFWITRAKCRQNKNGLNICRIALQRIALLQVQKIHGPTPSGISDFNQCPNFEVQKSGKKQASI